MNSRDSLYKFEGFKPFHASKSPSAGSHYKFDEQISPRSSEVVQSRFLQTFESLKDRPTLAIQKSQDVIRNPKQPILAKNLSVHRRKSEAKKSTIEEVSRENKELKAE